MIGLGVVAEMDDRGALGEWWEVQCAEREEAQSDVVAFVDDDPHDLEIVLEEVRNVECILRQETKVVVSASLGGTWLTEVSRGKSCSRLTTHAMRFGRFPTHQEDISTLASRTSENGIRERCILGQIVATAENQSY